MPNGKGYTKKFNKNTVHNYFRLADTGCWEWTRCLNPNGYARIGDQYAHRLVYIFFHGPIPEGLEIDHLCRNRKCINPEHVEAVTSQVNGLRGRGPAAANAAKTHCKNGHLFDAVNTYIRRDDHTRQCRQCCKERRHRREEVRSKRKESNG